MLKQFILKKFLIFLKKFVFCIASAQRLRDIFWCTCSAVALRACIRLGPHVCCRTVSMRCPGALAQLQHRVRAYDLGRMFAAAQPLCVVLVHLLSCSSACLPTTSPAYTLPRSLYALSSGAQPSCKILYSKALAQLQHRLLAIWAACGFFASSMHRHVKVSKPLALFHSHEFHFITLR
jgi:hypothetical protein